MRRLFPFYLTIACLILAGCGEARGEYALGVIEQSDALTAPGVRIGEAGQALRAATADGLVGRDASARVVPALADRWIVTEDGLSYIFRLRDGLWGDGSEIDSESARARLRARLTELNGTSLGRDLEIIAEIRAMAGRVVEIRLASPMPQFLDLLAQPELALADGDRIVGPLRIVRADDGEGATDRASDRLTLLMTPPEQLGQPIREGWEADYRTLAVRALTAEEAVGQFDSGALDVVFGGTIDDFPLAPTGPLTSAAIQIDPAVGLFGLRIMTERGLLAEATLREAIAMAIDREALAARFNIGGWAATTKLVNLPESDPAVAGAQASEERWVDLTLEERQDEGLSRVSRWRADNPELPPRLSIALPAGPGGELLFAQLRDDLRSISIALDRAVDDEDADLVLVDRIARYAAPRWFFNQLACGISPRAPCVAEADELVDAAILTVDPQERAMLLGDARRLLVEADIFIPLAQPLRWSLVRGGVEGFVPNSYAFHPLPPFATITR